MSKWSQYQMRIVNPELRPGQKHVVIIGAGFGGLNAAKILCQDKNFVVSLIDQKNHHLFQPLLYQVATAGLNPSDIAVPIRAQFTGNDRIYIHMAKVDKIDLKQRWVSEAGKDLGLGYDYLILACGAQHSYFGKDHWEAFAPGLKTLEQATEIRRRILSAFELAENELDPEVQKSLLNFVIVGGGPTGVELAGAIAEISRTVLLRDFRRINPASASIILVEASSRVLSSFSPDLSQRTVKDLEALGVEVRLNTLVAEINQNGLRAGENWITTRSVFWAAGVKATQMALSPPLKLDPSGRICVDKDFSIPEFPEAFVIGDMAHYDLADAKILPGLAPAAIQAAQFVALTITARAKGKQISCFKYNDKGQMATIGKHKAVASAGPFKLTGFIAWLAWLFVHVLYLVGFKNRIGVFMQWVWSYLFSKRGSRLITEREWQSYLRAKEL